MNINYKKIKNSSNVVGRGTVIYLEEFNPNIKANKKICLYDKNKTFLTEGIVIGIEFMGNKNMGLVMNTNIYNISDITYYTH